MAKVTKILIAVIAGGAILRIISILNRGPFRFDELSSVHFSAYPLKNFSWIFYEASPPFFYFILHFWTRIFGSNELVSRIPALIFGLLSILLIYFIGKNLFSAKTGLAAAILVSLSSYQIFLSTEARMYSCLFFFSLLSMYFFWQWINTATQKYQYLWFISSLILVFTHLTGWLIIMVQTIYFFISHCQFRVYHSRRFVGLVLILLLIFLLWFAPVYFTKTNSSFNQSWFSYLPQTSFYFLNLMRNFFLIGSTLPIADLIFNSLLLFFIFIFIFKFKKIGSKNWKINFNLEPLKLYLICWLFLPLLIGFIFQINYQVNYSFYFVTASGALYLLIAVSSGNLDKFLSKIFLGLFLVCLLPAVSSILILSNPTQNILNWVKNQEKPGDKIIVHTFCLQLNYQYYYRGQIPIEGFYPLEDNLSDDLRIIKKNGQNIVNEKNVEKLSFSTNGHERIFLIHALPPGMDPNHLILNWFYKNNWHLKEKKSFYGVDGATVFLFER